MYIQEISIDIKTKVGKDEHIDEFGLLMSFYRGSGQTQGRIESQYIESDKIVCLPFTLEKAGLFAKISGGTKLCHFFASELICFEPINIHKG